MPQCTHESIELLGEQKTDDGVNSYLKCRGCGYVFVVLPSRKIVGISNLQRGHLPGDSPAMS